MTRRHTTKTPELLQPADRHLPTSRHELTQEPNILKRLRSLAPHRPLTERHAEELAEAQAALLLRLAGLHEPPVPSALICDLPRVWVRLEANLPISGATHWVNGRWVLFIHGGEPLEQQRFSLGHEYKHAVDHRARRLLYRDRPDVTAGRQAELAADAFAAALLMPADWVRAAWFVGNRDAEALSRLFQVSLTAMRARLHQLRLTQPTVPDQVLEAV
jgi:hypothetical protein